MATKRVISERDAWRYRDHQRKRVYRIETVAFEGLFSHEPISQTDAERIIDRCYARYAPSRRRPAFVMPRSDNPHTCASYSPLLHRIWGRAMTRMYLEHEIAHSLTYHPDWGAHGAEFTRLVVDIYCRTLAMRIKPRVELVRSRGIDISDRVRIGLDPTKVQWIR